MIMFANRKRSADCSPSQHGFTLFELLIALALVALLALTAIGGVRASSPKIAVKLASEQLLADIKRARVESNAANAPVTIVFHDGAYAITMLNLNRTPPRGVSIKVFGAEKNEVVIGPGFWLTEYRIVISKGDAQAAIIIDSVTRRTTLQ